MAFGLLKDTNAHIEIINFFLNDPWIKILNLKV